MNPNQVQKKKSVRIRLEPKEEVLLEQAMLVLLGDTKFVMKSDRRAFIRLCFIRMLEAVVKAGVSGPYFTAVVHQMTQPEWNGRIAAIELESHLKKRTTQEPRWN